MKKLDQYSYDKGWNAGLKRAKAQLDIEIESLRAALASEWERAYRAGLEVAAREADEHTCPDPRCSDARCRPPIIIARAIRALPVPVRPEDGK